MGTAYTAHAQEIHNLNNATSMTSEMRIVKSYHHVHSYIHCKSVSDCKAVKHLHSKAETSIKVLVFSGWFDLVFPLISLIFSVGTRDFHTQWSQSATAVVKDNEGF